MLLVVTASNHDLVMKNLPPVKDQLLTEGVDTFDDGISELTVDTFSLFFGHGAALIPVYQIFISENIFFLHIVFSSN